MLEKPETDAPAPEADVLYTTNIGFEIDGVPRFLAVSCDDRGIRDWMVKAFQERGETYGPDRFRIVAAETLKTLDTGGQ